MNEWTLYSLLIISNGNSKFQTRNSKLEIPNSKLETRNSKLGPYGLS